MGCSDFVAVDFMGIMIILARVLYVVDFFSVTYRKAIIGMMGSLWDSWEEETTNWLFFKR